MISVRRVLSMWGSLHLSVGAGLMTITQALLEGTVRVPVVVGSAGALVTTVVLLHRHPELESSVVRRFGFLTIVLFVGGNVVAADGAYAPAGERSLLVIGFLWLVSMAIAYELSTGERYERVLKRVVFR